MNEIHVVEMKDVEFAYGDLEVLEDVNVAVHEGDFVGVVGPNGGGKTTLIKLMLGLLEPDSGSVTLFGGDPCHTRQRVGYVPQKFQYNVNFPVTVMDVVLMGQLGSSRFYGPYSAGDRAAALRALCRVNLDDMSNRPFDSLSGGQMQRALIARALTSEPDMLMLDEPTASLDAPAEADIYALLQRLNEQMTIIVVTHDFGFVSEIVESVLCVNRTVNRHPTSELDDVTGDLLKELYGSDLRMVRHDMHLGEDRCID